MEVPESVLTKGRKGKLEIRGLDNRGSYVMCKYIDPKTMSLADTKRELLLKDENGKIRVLHHSIKGSQTGTLNHTRNGGEEPPNLERQTQSPRKSGDNEESMVKQLGESG